jgi:hypothetical protein
LENHQQHYNRNGVDHQTMQTYCQMVMEHANDADKLLSAARLIVGAQIEGYGEMLRDKLIARAKAMSEEGPGGASEAAAIGEAMLLLQQLAS